MSVPSSPKLSQQEAEQCAAQVLTDMEITSLPVLPIRIAQRKDITVKPFSSPDPGICGFLMMHHGRFGIGYADHLDNDGFVNFTLGHELGHYFLDGHIDFIFRDGQTTHYSKGGFISQEPHEKQADYFSAGLLMPERLFIPALRKAGTGLPAVQTLAALCKTSLTATAIRLAKFAEDPVAMIVSSNDQIEYAFTSTSLQEVSGVTGLRKGDSLPSRCATRRFNSKRENVLRSEKMESCGSLSDWFEHAPEHEMNEDVIGLGKYGKTLTILFTTDAIEQDDEEDFDADRRWS